MFFVHDRSTHKGILSIMDEKIWIIFNMIFQVIGISNEFPINHIHAIEKSGNNLALFIQSFVKHKSHDVRCVYIYYHIYKCTNNKYVSYGYQIW